MERVPERGSMQSLWKPGLGTGTGSLLSNFHKGADFPRHPGRGPHGNVPGSHSNLKENLHCIHIPSGPTSKRGRYLRIPCNRNPQKAVLPQTLRKSKKVHGKLTVLLKTKNSAETIGHLYAKKIKKPILHTLFKNDLKSNQKLKGET